MDPLSLSLAIVAVVLLAALAAVGYSVRSTTYEEARAKRLAELGLASTDAAGESSSKKSTDQHHRHKKSKKSSKSAGQKAAGEARGEVERRPAEEGPGKAVGTDDDLERRTESDEDTESSSAAASGKEAKKKTGKAGKAAAGKGSKQQEQISETESAQEVGWKIAQKATAKAKLERESDSEPAIIPAAKVALGSSVAALPAAAEAGSKPGSQQQQSKNKKAAGKVAAAAAELSSSKITSTTIKDSPKPVAAASVSSVKPPAAAKQQPQQQKASTPQQAVETSKTSAPTSAVSATSLMGNGPVTKTTTKPADFPSEAERVSVAIRDSADRWSDDVIRKLVSLLNAKLKSPASGVAGDEWEKKNQKGDPVTALRKQLEEKELVLRDEAAKGLAASSRYNEMKQELKVARDKLYSVEQQAQQQKTSLMAEIEALKTRMQTTHEQHLAEMKTLRDAASANTSDHHGETQTSPSRNDEHDMKLRILDDALKQNAIQLNTAKNAESLFRSKFERSEEENKKLKEKDGKLEKRVEELLEELLKAETKSRSMTAEIAELRKTKENEIKSSSEQLKLKETFVTELESQMTSLNSQLEQLKQNLADKEAKTEENETQAASSAELQEKVKLLEAQLSQTTKDLDEKEAELKSLRIRDALTVDMAEHERIISEKDSALDELKGKLLLVKEECNNADLQRELDETKQLKAKLQSDVERYQNVLAETENILKSLQTRTEAEELDWRQKLQTAEEHWLKAQEENKKLQGQLLKLNNGDGSNHVGESNNNYENHSS